MDSVPDGRSAAQSRGLRMNLRTVTAWTGFCWVALSLTGCAGSSNNNYIRPNSPTGTPGKNPLMGQPTASAPATSSGWARNTNATQNQGSPSALAQPMGNSPQFTNMPSGGITPSGGLAPPTPISNSGAGMAPNLPGVGTTSNMIPAGQSMNNLNSGTSLAPTTNPIRQVAANAPQIDKSNLRIGGTAPASDDAPEPAAPMPPAPAGSELPVQPPAPITSLSPVTLQPTKVRQ